MTVYGSKGGGALGWLNWFVTGHVWCHINININIFLVRRPAAALFYFPWFKLLFRSPFGGGQLIKGRSTMYRLSADQNFWLDHAQNSGGPGHSDKTTFCKHHQSACHEDKNSVMPRVFFLFPIVCIRVRTLGYITKQIVRMDSVIPFVCLFEANSNFIGSVRTIIKKKI